MFPNIQGYPQKMRVQRRLQGIKVPCRPKLAFYLLPFDKRFNYSIECKNQKSKIKLQIVIFIEFFLGRLYSTSHPLWVTLYVEFSLAFRNEFYNKLTKKLLIYTILILIQNWTNQKLFSLSSLGENMSDRITWTFRNKDY